MNYVNINKKFLIEGIKKRAWEELFKKTRKAKSANEIENLLGKWLSAAERNLLEKRIAISLLIKEGIRHNEIKRRLDVSSATISFVKRGLIRLPKKEKKIEKLTAKDFKRPRKKTRRFPA